jgi:methylmalonyl-CoA epimerase
LSRIEFRSGILTERARGRTGMLKKIDHIGILVENIQSGIESFEKILGLKLERLEELKIKDYISKIAFFSLGGVHLEIIQSGQKEGMMADFLQRFGEGIHHIAFEVESLEEVVEKLKMAQVKFLVEMMKGVDNTKAAFIEPSQTLGVLVELVEK